MDHWLMFLFSFSINEIIPSLRAFQTERNHDIGPDHRPDRFTYQCPGQHNIKK